MISCQRCHGYLFGIMSPTLNEKSVSRGDVLLKDFSLISNPLEEVSAQRTDVDFTSSEIVTTGNGVIFSGSSWMR